MVVDHMKSKKVGKPPIENQPTNLKTAEEEYCGPQVTLSHKEAKAGSPFDSSGEEDPGAALELLVT
jgi:hypothetical protein